MMDPKKCMKIETIPDSNSPTQCLLDAQKFLAASLVSSDYNHSIVLLESAAYYACRAAAAMTSSSQGAISHRAEMMNEVRKR